jgi:hypothetical protein
MDSFKIYLIYHSHIDIGYTDRQERIADYQADFTRQAVDCVLKNQEFKYTAEGFWAIEQYLEKYGINGENRLIEAIKTNRFEIVNNYLHFSELLDQEMMDKSLEYGIDFFKKHNLNISDVSMINDVNGFAWGYADAMYRHGVRYLFTSINTHHGGLPFDKPLMPFYWKTHKGNKLLVWNGLSYHKGNLLGLIPGWTFKGDAMVPGLEPVEGGFVKIESISDFAEERIHSLVNAYRKSDYPYNFLPISASGVYTDNSPISDNHVSLIKSWNERFGNDIEIQLVTLKELFKVIEAQDNIIETSGDWNDYWTDGVLSTPDETRLFLNARRNKDLINKLDSKHQIIQKSDYDELLKKLILYAEHTWGHSASYSDPYRLLVKQLDFRKSSLAIEADKLSHIMLDKVRKSLGEGEFKVDRPFEYIAINPHNVSLNDEVELPIDFWEEGYFSKQSYVIADSSGLDYPTQRKSTLRGSFFSTTLTLEPNEQKQLFLVPKKDLIENTVNDETGLFIGDFYDVKYDFNGIKSIRVDGIEQLEEIAFCQPVYEVFKGGNRSSAAGFGYSKRNVPESQIFMGRVKDMQIIHNGPVFLTLRYVYELEGTDHVFTDITFFKHTSSIKVNMLIGKHFTIDPEGLYARFSFSTNNSKWLIDKPGTLIEPGNQIPGTCFDYYSVQRGVVLSNNKKSVVVNLLDSPLVTFERIKLWEFNKTIENKGDLFVWLANNKWETNFRTETAGYLESRFVISFTSNDEVNSFLDKSQNSFVVLRK